MILTEQEIFGCLPPEEDTIEFARAIESAVLEKLKAQKPVGWYFMDDPQVVAMPGSGFFPGSTPPNDAINLVPLYNHPDPRVAELEAALRECRGVLSFINRLDDDRDFLDQPEYEQIHKAIAKIDEVLNEDR